MESNNSQGGYHLVWSDEFGGDSPHVRSWNYVIHESGWANNELQEYIAGDKYVCVKNGNLIIHPFKALDYKGDLKYYSGMLDSRNKHEFRYGRVEARIKVPKGKGLHPSFRLVSLPDDFDGVTRTGFESINIMDFNGEFPDRITAGTRWGLEGIRDFKTFILEEGEDLSLDYHDYACEWDPGRIRFFFDGKEIYKTDDRFGKERSSGRSFFPVFSVAVGGDGISTPPENMVFDYTCEMRVDSIRVYKKDRYEDPDNDGKLRKSIAVCGVWEDAENLSLFMEAFQNKKITEKYLVECFTFGIATDNQAEIDTEMLFADFLGKMDHAAILIFGEMIKTNGIIERLIEYGREKTIPVIMLERQFPGCINAVLEYADGFEQAVRHVIEHHGCRVVDMFAGFRGNPFSEERIEVYKRVLKEHDIPFEEWRVHYGDFWDAPTSQVLSNLLDSGYRLPEAFVCANDSMAVGVCDTLYKYGYRVPDDCIVTGFDGIWKSEYHNPAICTCKLDLETIADEILEKIEAWTPAMNGVTQEIKFKYRLVPNHSCGCLDQKDRDWTEIVSSLTSVNQDYFRHILEMGRFISGTISMSDIDKASRDLEKYLWLWKWEYYFVGINEGDNIIHAIFQGRNGEYKYGLRYNDIKNGLPDIDELRSPSSGINVILFKQVRVKDKGLGYIAEGFNHVDLRSQQRFEEFSIFMSAMANTVLNNSRLINANREIEKLSETDYLTGLYNRRGFFKQIEAVLADNMNKGRSLTMYSLDMDGLKIINDMYGHFEGDMAIMALAHAVRSVVGKDGMCARYGGDEFAFAMVSDQPLSEEADLVRQEIERIANGDIEGCKKDYRISASIGSASATISRRTDIEELIRESDEKMYEDKESRR